MCLWHPYECCSRNVGVSLTQRCLIFLLAFSLIVLGFAYYMVWSKPDKCQKDAFQKHFHEGVAYGYWVAGVLVLIYVMSTCHFASYTAAWILFLLQFVPFGSIFMYFLDKECYNKEFSEFTAADYVLPFLIVISFGLTLFCFSACLVLLAPIL